MSRKLRIVCRLGIVLLTLLLAMPTIVVFALLEAFSTRDRADRFARWAGDRIASLEELAP